MAEITIKDFRGVNLKEGLWEQGFSAYASGVDFYGLGDDNQKLSYAGTLQGALSLSSMPQAASTNNITQLIRDFALLPSNNRVYGIDITSNNSRMYKWVPATPNWILDHTISGFSGSNIALYNNILYYTNYTGTAGTANAQLGSFDGTTYTDAFQTGLYTDIILPMKVYSGYLFVANNRYIDRYDGTTYQKQKLLLPLEFTVRSMEVFRDGLYISADNGQFSRIFIWDGSSPTYNDSIPLPNESYAPSLVASQGFLWIIGNRGGANSTTAITFLTPIYIIQPGSQPELLFELPILRDSSSFTSGVGVYQNGVLIASGEGAGNTYENGVGGVWFIGKDIQTGLFHASNMFNALNNFTPGGIYSTGRTQQGPVNPAMYVATKYNSTYGVYQAASPSLSDNSFYTPLWYSLLIDAGSTKNKSWHSVKLNFEALATSQKVRIDYRTENANSWTVLKSFASTDPSTDRTMFVHLGVTSRTIQFRIFFGPAVASVGTTRLYSMTIYYEPSEA